MASVKDALWSAPLGGAVAPVIGAAVPELRDKLFNIGADETKAPEEEKKKEEEKKAEAVRQNANVYQPTYKKGGKVSSASKRADGCAVKGKTRGRIV